MSQRTLSVAAALVLTLALAACGEESEGPVTTPPPTIGAGSSDGSGGEPSDGGGEGEASDGGGESEGTTDAASSVPAPDPADYPGMDEETPEGAEQAFSYFWDVALWGHRTGDSDQLTLLYDKECEPCAVLTGDIDKLSEADAFWDDADIEVVSIEVDSNWEQYDAVVTYSFVIKGHAEPNRDGDGTVDVPDQGVTAVGALTWKDKSWSVVDLSTESSELAG